MCHLIFHCFEVLKIWWCATYSKFPSFYLKGQCHEFFCFRFFHESSSPKPLKITLVHFKFFFQKFAKIFASQGAPPVSTTPVANFATSSAGVDDAGGKFATGVNDASSKFATGVNDAGGKLPTVSMNLRQSCHRCQQHRWQTTETISDYWQLKVNLKEKIYLDANSTTQRCPKEIMKNFLIFSIWHWWCTLSCQYLHEFSKKLKWP